MITTKSAAPASVFLDRVVSANIVRLILIALAERVAATYGVFTDQVVSASIVRLILIALVERVAVGSHVSPVQLVSVITVRLIPIAPAERVVVAANAIIGLTASGYRVVPMGLIAEILQPVVTELARTYMTIVLMLAQP